jgi:hypothetical protein
VSKPVSIPEFKRRLAKHIEATIERVAGDIQDLAKRERIKKSLWDTAHAEPGQHEPSEVGTPDHMEPGAHEQFEVNPPASPDTTMDVGGGTDVPGGQLNADTSPGPGGGDPNGDLCPLCKMPDQPGSCCCLDNYMLGKTEDREASIRARDEAKDPTLKFKRPHNPNDIDVQSNWGQHPPKGIERRVPPKPFAKEEMAKGTKNSTIGPGDIGGGAPTPPPPPAPVVKNELCKSCGKSHEIDKCEMRKGEICEECGNEKCTCDANMPPEKGGEKVKASKGSGGDPKKNSLGKTDVPAAKPPSGKVPGASAPPMASNTSKPTMAKGGNPSGNTTDPTDAPMAMTDMEKGALNPQMKQHAMIDASKAAAGVKPPAPMASAPKPLTNPNDMSRANNFAAAQAGAFKPTGPVSSGLELAGKPGAKPNLTPPPAGVREKPAGGAAPAPVKSAPVMNAALPKPKGLVGGLFGKNEKCPFCKGAEHPGDCTNK